MAARSESYDLVVIGGGPAGHAAALEAAAVGASVALVEAEALGGQCVHATCIPNAVVGASAATFAEAQELSLFGVFDAGEDFSLRRAATRREQLVGVMAGGVAASLRAAGCEVVQGRGTVDGREVRVGDRRLGWSSLVVATGSRWEAPAVAGVEPGRVTTPDGIHALSEAPARAVVVAGGSGRTAFSLEAAAILALAGTEVTVVAEGEVLVPWLDPPASAAAIGALAGYGVTVERAALGDLGDRDADLVVVPDERLPFLAGLGLDALGAADPDRVPAAPGQPLVTGVHVAGDATGRGFLTSSAIAGGRVAARAALGRSVPWLPPDEALAHVLHLPEVGWVGRTAAEAEAEGFEVGVVHQDLAHSAHSLVAGGREGILSLVYDRELGGVLGAQVVGPGAGPLVNAAAAAMQSEQAVADLAAVVASHPDPLEALVDAARRAATDVAVTMDTRGPGQVTYQRVN